MKISPIASAVQVQLDKLRTLILDFNAFAEYSQVMGEELPDVLAAMFKRDDEGNIAKDDNGAPIIAKPLNTKQMRALIWAGCMHEDDALTLQQVGRYLSQRNFQTIMQAAFTSLYGIEDEPADPTLAQAQGSLSSGTGTESGVSADTSLHLVTSNSGS